MQRTTPFPASPILSPLKEPFQIKGNKRGCAGLWLALILDPALDEVEHCLHQVGGALDDGLFKGRSFVILLDLGGF